MAPAMLEASVDGEVLATPRSNPQPYQASGKEAMNDKIGVREMPLPAIERVDVYRNNDHLVLMIDGRVYALSREAATELAYSICSHVEAMDR